MAANNTSSGNASAILENIELEEKAAPGLAGEDGEHTVHEDIGGSEKTSGDCRVNRVLLATVIVVIIIAAVIVIVIYFSGRKVPSAASCDVTQWACLDNVTCIDVRARCDGKADCPMIGEDELSCMHCRAYQFDCGDGSCGALHFQCNGRSECANGADEAGCSHEGPPCLSNHYTCDDGTCIPLHQQCNYFLECPDHSDEMPDVCGKCNSENEFECDLGNCIPEYWRCDFYPDCAGGEDEQNCAELHGSELIEVQMGQSVNISSPNWPLPYEPGQYHLWNITARAPNSSYVLLLHFRDYSLAFQSLLTIFEGHNVSDGSSVLGQFSHTDSPGNVRSFTDSVSVQFHAGAYIGTRGFLLEVTALRNDDPRLPNCNADHLFCEFDRKCIAASRSCDGETDCSDGSDEEGCLATTPSLTVGGCNAITEYECMKDGNEAPRCIPWADRCNYFLDCPLFDDETNCACQEDDFRCVSGQCIPSYLVCDYYYDCLHGNEDEVNCATPNNTYSHVIGETGSITIQTPNYPSNYQPRAYAVYLIAIPLGYTATVVFNDFFIDWKGFVSFGTGLDVNDHAAIFAVFGHHDNPTTVYVPVEMTTRSFFVEFHGGPYGRSRGFSMTISAVPV